MKAGRAGKQIEHDLRRGDGWSRQRKLDNGSSVREAHRFLSTADSATRAQVMDGLQGSLGNAAVQRLAASKQEAAVQRSSQKGLELVVQRAIEVKFEGIKNPVLAESFETPSTPTGGQVSFTKKVDGHSPALHKAMSDGTLIPKVEVEFSRETSGGAESLRYIFKDTYLSSISTGGSEVPLESVSLDFQEVEAKYLDTPKGKRTEMKGKRAKKPYTKGARGGRKS